MNGRIIRLLLGLALAALLTAPSLGMDAMVSLSGSEHAADAPTHGGWLETRGDVSVLHLNGSYYEMGYQHGMLLDERIAIAMRAQLDAFESHGYSYDDILAVWHVMQPYLPGCYLEEIRGMADGSSLSFEQVAVLNTMPALFNHMISCCEMSLWGNATVSGDLYHVRSFDWSLDVMDPETGTPLQDTLVVMVRDPASAHASLYPEFAGNIGCWSGFNEHGIAIGEDTCLTNDTTFHGISAFFRMRMVLDRADDAGMAVDIMTGNRTCGWNFVLSDAGRPAGYALEQTANISYVGTWDSAEEGVAPFWRIEDVVRRTPMFVTPACAEVELNRVRYDPSGPLSFFWALSGKTSMFVPWTHYRALSEEVERRYGALDLNGTMDLLRDEYTGRTDLVFGVAVRMADIYRSLFQWVACPSSGEMVVSFAGGDTRACSMPVHYFRLDMLL
jgi:hypothetical protein